MKGYLIYQKEEAIKNQAYIRLFCEEGRTLGVRFEYVAYNEYQDRQLPDFVLNRTRDAAVSRWYEERGVFVFHSSLITEIGNHKMKTLDYLRRNLSNEILEKRWAPVSYLIKREQIKQWVEAIPSRNYVVFCEAYKLWESEGTCILKSVDGHGGSEVAELFMPLGSIEEERERAWKRLQDALMPFMGKDCILQEKISSDSQDVRVYILGNQIYQGILRQGKKDFRSNYSLGGFAREYELSEKEKVYVEQFLAAFKNEILGLAGLDFILDKEGNLIFNELEEMVGSRMLYQKTNHNVVRDYVIWIKKFIENNGCQQ